MASPIQGATAIRHGMSISRRDARMLHQRGEQRIGRQRGRRRHGEAQLDPRLEEWRNHDKHRRIYGNIYGNYVIT